MKKTNKSPLVNCRVEIPCYTDAWMRGARMGTIAWVSDNHERRTLEVNPVIVGVRMDNPRIRNLQWVRLDDCRDNCERPIPESPNMTRIQDAHKNGNHD